MALFDRFKKKGSKISGGDLTDLALPVATPGGARVQKSAKSEPSSPVWLGRAFVAPMPIEGRDFANKKVWIQSNLLAERIPRAFRRIDAHEADRKVYFHVNELAVLVSHGSPSASLSMLASYCPELINVEALEEAASPPTFDFPWHAIIEQLQSLHDAATAETAAEGKGSTAPHRLAPPPELLAAMGMSAPGIPLDSEPSEFEVPAPGSEQETARPPEAEPRQEMPVATAPLRMSTIEAPAPVARIDHPATPANGELLHQLELLKQQNAHLVLEKENALHDLLSSQTAWRKRVADISNDRERALQDKAALSRQLIRLRRERDHLLAACKESMALLSDLTTPLPVDKALQVLQILSAQVTSQNGGSQSGARPLPPST